MLKKDMNLYMLCRKSSFLLHSPLIDKILCNLLVHKKKTLDSVYAIYPSPDMQIQSSTSLCPPIKKVSH